MSTEKVRDMPESLESLDSLEDLIQEANINLDNEFDLDSVIEDAEPVIEKTDEEKAVEYMAALMEARVVKLKEVLTAAGLNDAAIDALKKRFDSIYTFAPSDTDPYVYRPIYKHEWDMINKGMAGGDPATQQERTAVVVITRCVLHPRLDKNTLQKTRAGLLSSLYEVILQSSYFYNPDQAMSMIVEL